MDCLPEDSSDTSQQASVSNDDDQRLYTVPYRDERIMVITTNKKDRHDVTLCGPVVAWTCAYTSYCTNQGFTANEVAEELMKSEDADIALAGVVNFLKRKKMEANKIEEENET